MAVNTGINEHNAIESVPKQLLIGGRWVDGSSGSRLAVEDPSTGETIAEVADATAHDAHAALDAAATAQRTWRDHPPRERAEILRRAHEALIDRIDELAMVMTLEMGKPLAESQGEIRYAADFLRWFSEEAVRIAGRYQVAPGGQGRFIVMKQPVGPSYLVTPWNFPAAMAARKIGPAIAAGCTAILKPAKQAPLSALALAQIMQDCGLPDGVLNVITSSSAGAVSEPIVNDPRLRKLSFTGSTEIGRKLIEQSAHQVLNTSMELGGNAPFLVFDDADLDDAVEGALLAKMRNIGEACTTANRFYVADSLAHDFAARLGERMGSMKVGRGTDEGAQVGPLIDDRARAKVDELVTDAVGRGAAVIIGGHRGEGAGYFYMPTVLGNVPEGARVLKEEIFGPVAPVKSFTSEQQAIEWANDTEYGLVAYVYTRDLGRAFRVMEALEYGMVGLNRGIVSDPAAPFGGVKHSGLGREGGFEGIDEYLETKYCAVSF
ncbi:MAG: NAD-dependent succinate-semialdehyde dehydrogenase [Solirubrobacterales bacterium]